MLTKWQKLLRFLSTLGAEFHLTLSIWPKRLSTGGSGTAASLGSHGRRFPELVGLNGKPLKPTSVKGGHGVFFWHPVAIH